MKQRTEFTQIIQFVSSAGVAAATELSASKNIYLPQNATITGIHVGGTCNAIVGGALYKGKCLGVLSDPASQIKQGQGDAIRLQSDLSTIKDTLTFYEGQNLAGMNIRVKGMLPTQFFLAGVTIYLEAPAAANFGLQANMTINYYTESF